MSQKSYQTNIQIHEKQTIDAMKKLSAKIAHEFSNILTPILSFSSLAQNSTHKEEELSKYLNQIHHYAETGRNFLNKLKQYSVQRESIAETINLKDLIHNILDKTKSGDSNLNNTSLDFDCDKIFIEGSYDELAFIITSVLDNAADAVTKEGLVNISVTNNEYSEKVTNVTNDTISGSYVCITIKDNGYGIKSHEIEKVFNPLFTTKDKSKRLGLSLSIVYDYIINSNMCMNIYSEENIGTEVSLFLPLQTKL